MLKKISNFIVNKRILILALMLMLAVVSIFCSRFVEVNEDMTKYLPNDSNMKTGIDIMEKEFPEMETSGTIRVMFDDLNGSQKETILQKLESIAYVDSVDYDAKSSGYNKDNHTLYVLEFSCEYGSDEELAIESALESGFDDYQMVWQSNDSGFPAIPLRILIVVMVILLVILFTMCGSWMEPILFLITIGVAVVINSGSNLIMGSVANITNSISTILQLVLSIDYSIILMNRYRQEKELEPDKVQAMKNALANAFSSVASSSLTTVVGLLMLVFMSFKIGADLGIVLAKGVFISMVCVLTMLPGILLACDKLIAKTAKKVPQIPMNWAAGFSHKMRYIMTGLFILLFIGAYILQRQTGIAYTLVKEDVIADVFPKDNMLVMVYENQDEDKVNELASSLEKDEKIKSVMGYGTTLGKAYTSGELADALKDMGEDISLSSGVIDMLYYDYYGDGKTGTMTAGGFLSFVSDTVMNDESFSEYIDDSMKENADMLGRFADADADALTAPMTAEELADFFDMDMADINDLFLLYYTKNGGVSTDSMTLSTFADFVVNEVSNDAAYSSMFDEAALSSLTQLSVFTDATKVTTPYTYKDIASLLNIDESLIKTVFTLHNAQDVSGKKMTLPQFTDFLCNHIMNDPMFGSAFDGVKKEQLQSMNTLIQLAASDQGLTSDKMAQSLGMDENMINQLYLMYFSANGSLGQETDVMTISLPDFLAFLAGNVLGNEAYSGSFTESQKAQLTTMNQLVHAAASGVGLDTVSLAQTFGIEEGLINTVFRLYFGGDVSGKKLSLKNTVDFILTDPVMKNYMDTATTGQLKMMQTLIRGSVNGTAYTSDQISDLTGMDKERVGQLYLLYTSRHGDTSGWTLSVKGFIDFMIDNVLADSEYAERIDADTSDMISSARTMTDAVISGKAYTAAEMGNLMSGLSEELEPSMIELLYLYADSLQNANSAWTMTLETLFHYLIDDVMHDSRFEAVIDPDMRQKLLDAEKTLNEGKEQLVTSRYSRLVITTAYPEEGEDTTAFLTSLEEFGNNNLEGKYYLIGNSAMNHEMQKTFDSEFRFITLLTAAAIFLIVALTFKSVSIPAILVLLVQCGVYITVTVTGILSGSMYYLALLIVECILMGATIDYGILYTNYYRESRRMLDVKEALKKAYAGSIHTIMTSGLILVTVTAVVGGMFEEATVSAIVKTLSIGSFCAIVLILFILPGVLAVCDKVVVKKKETNAD